MLVLAAPDGVAQTSPQNPPSSSEGPIRRQVFETDQPLPEALRKHLKLPPGATFKDLPTRQTRTKPRAKRYFRALTHLATETGQHVPAAADAVIASERLGLTHEAWELDVTIKLDNPLRGEVPKGTVFIREVREADGEELYCIARTPGEMFQPFVDARRAMYPSLCLFDSDKDGSPDGYKAEPYRAEDPVIVRPIGRTLAWAPLSPQSNSPHLLGFTLTRQLRVQAIDAQQVTLVSQLELLPPGSTKPIVSIPSEWPTVVLNLREGEQAAIGGVTVRVAKVDGAWQLRATGRFLPWAELNASRTGYRVLPRPAPASEQ